ncbi:MAG: peroxiredoxin family protein [Pseudomonadales bacterium]|nr:peroxiredoxin family protein [Pseudomonadales bacterium]
MKNILAILTALLLAVAVVGYLFFEPLQAFTYARLTRDMFVAYDNDNFDPGPLAGSRFPGINASYRGGKIQLVEEFAGRNGMVFIADRSLDWCPYSMRHIIELQKSSGDFAAAGIGMLAVTYDEPDLQQAFIEKYGITIPVLSDNNALSFKTLGILNEHYQRGDYQYGVPYPGIIVINPQGEVVGKLFLEGYRTRVDAAAALTFAKAALKIE